ncbi:glycosyl hydrolase family 47 [Zalerion maritima]|uniref:alpha-1,2-Mannosidase n=1 Tax=Zalerion maritima TaxID=339359 RepID=A0AAD5RZ61_9PEZI|nr:glycosyl hydrolase family 47 [Zalerion maritima]
MAPSARKRKQQNGRNSGEPTSSTGLGASDGGGIWQAIQNRRLNLVSPRTKWAIVFALLAVSAAYFIADWASDNALGLSHYSPTQLTVDWNQRRGEVRDAFLDSWNAYEKYAWGKDVFHPISKTGGYMSPSGLGWIIVDSLDTLMLMNLTEPIEHANEWIKDSLTWDQDQDVNTFETTIRMMGGLLSAHYLSNTLSDMPFRDDNLYLDKATDLADRLLVGYGSKTGIPYASVNIGKKEGIVSHADGGASSTAEASTTQLEMKYLSQLTGNPIYWRKSEKVLQVLDEQAMPGGLLPIFVHPEVGRFTTREIRLGSRGDSYYEYLIKQYHQTGEVIYRDMWEDALDGIQRHMITTTKEAAVKIVAELPNGVGGALSPKVDHLVCFLPGSIALGATGGRTLAEARRSSGWGVGKEKDMILAAELTKTCWGMYATTETGLAPEIVWFDAAEEDLQPTPGNRWLRSTSNKMTRWKKDFVVKPLDAHNLQRPETVESLFMMYRITGNSMYREWGWKIFESFKKHTKVEEGFTSLNDVRTVPPTARDNMESFWLAETLKYLYLLFSPDDFMPLTEVVFNTEAHPFPRFTPEGELGTGWQRKHGRRSMAESQLDLAIDILDLRREMMQAGISWILFLEMKHLETLLPSMGMDIFITFEVIWINGHTSLDKYIPHLTSRRQRRRPKRNRSLRRIQINQQEAIATFEQKMHDSRPHPLLAQVPLVVSPAVSLPAAPTLPYTYKQMPSSLPPPGATGISGAAGPVRRPSSPPRSQPSTPTPSPSPNPAPNPAPNRPGRLLPRYVVSAAGTCAHPAEISAQCAALLRHVERMQSDAQRDLDAFEARRRDAELAEKRRVAPGWLDSEEKLLRPERPVPAVGGTGGAGAGMESKVQGLGRDMFTAAAGGGGGGGGGAPGGRTEEDEERELQDAVAGMSIGGQGEQKNKKEPDLGAEIDRAFGGL